MKKLLTLFLLASCISAEVSGQAFTVKISGGYAAPGLSNTSTIKGFQPLLSNNPGDVNRVLDPAYATITDLSNFSSYGNYSGPNGSYQDTIGTKSTVHNSYGRGGNFSVELGYKINPYFAVGIGFNYLFGSTTSATQLYGNNLAFTLGNNTTVTESTRAYGLSMMPNITVYGAKPEWKLKPFVRGGLAIPMAGNVIHDIHVNSPSALLNSTALTSDLRVETQSKFSIGFNGAVGLSYSPIPLISIWAEVNATSLNVAAQTSTLTVYNVDGVGLAGGPYAGKTTHADRLAGTGSLPDVITLLGGTNDPLTQYSRVIEFVDALDQSNNTQDYGKKRDPKGTHKGDPNYVDETKNHESLRQFAPFSNFGFNIGISINMSKKIFKDPFGKKAKKAETK